MDDVALSAKTEAAEAKLGAYLSEIGLPDEVAGHIAELVAEIGQCVSDDAFAKGVHIGVLSAVRAAKDAAKDALGIKEASP